MMSSLSQADLFATIKRIREMGGAIFYDRVPAGAANATAGGTGTARTSISTSYSVPSAAMELLAISPGVSPTAEAAADSLIAYADIQGTSYKRQPQQVFAPVKGVLLSAGAAGTTPQEWFMVRTKVASADQYDWGITPLLANAHNFKAWVDVMYSTKLSGLRAIVSQVSAKTSFNGAGNTSTSTLTLTDADELYEVASVVSPETAAVAQENQILSHNLQSSALDPVQSFTYGSDAPAVVVSTSGVTSVPQINRYLTPGLKFKAGVTSPLLTYTSTLDVATTNNLTVAHMARYLQRS